jgi:transposase
MRCVVRTGAPCASSSSSTTSSLHESRRTLRQLAQRGGRIVLHFLPPYSPESEVIERLWKQLHDHVTRNHAHTHRAIQPLMEAVDEFIEN